MHNSIYQVETDVLQNFDAMVKVGNIRNPWDWYVSLWSFGCMQRGGIRQTIQNIGTLFQQRLDNERSKLKKSVLKLKLKPLIKRYQQLDDLYADSNNRANCHAWLKMIIGRNSSLDIGEGYKNSKAASTIGLLSYRYLILYSHKGQEVCSSRSSFEDIAAHDMHQNFIDVFIRSEYLHEDLLTNCQVMGIEKETLQKVINSFSAKTNTSKRTSDYRHYYDSKSTDLVVRYDRLIIDKHGYQFE